MKPCPFCGGEAELHPSLAGFFVGCFNDGCVINPCSGEFVYDGVWDKEQEQAAIDAWNTRAERTCVAESHDCGDGLTGLYCSECGNYIDENDNYCPNCGAKVVSE